MNLIQDDETIDIDFLCKGKTVELKTSLIPDKDGTIENVIRTRDIKLLKRNDSIEELRGDIHVQIYYNQKRQAKDAWLSRQTIDLNSSDLEYLYEALLARAYTNTTTIVGWMDKETIVNDINKRPDKDRTWTFPSSTRLFWKSPIQESKPPMELISYLQNI